MQSVECVICAQFPRFLTEYVDDVFLTAKVENLKGILQYYNSIGQAMLITIENVTESKLIFLGTLNK